jgi:16S rRNA (guanine966-N2)-methyltransferase
VSRLNRATATSLGGGGLAAPFCVASQPTNEIAVIANANAGANTLCLDSNILTFPSVVPARTIARIHSRPEAYARLPMPRNNRTGPRRNKGVVDATPAAANPPSRYAAATRRRPGEVRIIGGEWRGRKLHFPQTGSLRPTPDRVRETLFNWLQFELAGKRCLDLFAGSGALGFEALSRGVAAVQFVEPDPAAARAIGEALRIFATDRGRVVQQDAFVFLRTRPEAPYGIVFLDPPYAERWLPRACAALEEGGWLEPDAFIYLEDAASHGAPSLPEGWDLLRSKKAGDVGYHLARRHHKT